MTVFNLGDHIIKIFKLVFVYFNNTQALVIILVQDRFDAGGFSCSRITKQKTVVSRSAFQKSFCIIDQFFLAIS